MVAFLGSLLIRANSPKLAPVWSLATSIVHSNSSYYSIISKFLISCFDKFIWTLGSNMKTVSAFRRDLFFFYRSDDWFLWGWWWWWWWWWCLEWSSCFYKIFSYSFVYSFSIIYSTCLVTNLLSLCLTYFLTATLVYDSLNCCSAIYARGSNSFFFQSSKIS